MPQQNIFNDLNIEPWSLREEIECSLSEKERTILYKRTGLVGEKHTLIEIGEAFGLSRERIRQIFEKSILKIKTAIEDSGQEQEIFNKLKKLADSAVQTNDLNIISDEYLGTGLSNMFVLMFPEFAIFDDDNLTNKHFVTKSMNVVFQKKISDIIECLNYQNSSVDIDEVVNHFECPIALISDIECISIKDGKIEIISDSKGFDRTSYSIIHKIFYATRTPMNINEIVEKTKLTEGQVRGVLDRYDEFVNVGLSTYALGEWGYIPGTSSELVKYFLNEAKEPLSRKQLIKLFRFQRFFKESSLDAAIYSDSDIVRVAEGYYALKSWGFEEFKNSERRTRGDYCVSCSEAIDSIVSCSDDYFTKKQIEQLAKNKYGDKVSTLPVTIYAALEELTKNGKIKKEKRGVINYYSRT